MTFTEITTALKSLLDALPESMATLDDSSVSTTRRKQLRELIQAAIVRLESLQAGLDPIKLPTFVFDPANPEVVGKLIGDTLLEQARVPLENLHRFYGSGVYAIYYIGRFPAYLPASGSDTPLYVGKADPSNPEARTPKEQGTRLWGRLNGDHAKNIKRISNLDINDFACRYLVVRTPWQGTAENYLINIFKPIWNDEVAICFGFGKHGDDPETRKNTMSPWDTLHPGRPWATKEGNRPNPLSVEEIIENILLHYKQNPPRPTRSRLASNARSRPTHQAA